jgi:phosphatidylethanolamine/phosphatidyl-N-methylethanolamine N-methyltransferase
MNNNAPTNFSSVASPTAARRSIELAQRGYRRFASLYDLFFGASLQPGRRIALEALDPRPGERILEVGVGTGLSLPLYPGDVHVTGIDISRDMLAKAMARVRKLRLLQVGGLLQMDAQRMAFANASFDKAAVMYAISGLHDPVRAVREIERVCRPGATIVIAGHFGSRGLLLRACERLLAPIYRLLHYRPHLDLESLLAATGLEVVGRRGANLFGYSTILVCRQRAAQLARR